MADGVNWDVAAPSTTGYGSVAPPDISKMLATLGQQPQQQRQGQQQQPGQPLNISPQGPGGPSWFDRLRSWLAGTATPTTAPNPNPPSPTPVGVPGVGPTPSPAPTPTALTPESMDEYLLRRYGTTGSNYFSTMEPRQAGGAVAPPTISNMAGAGPVPGYAGRLMGMAPQAPVVGTPPGAPPGAAVAPGMGGQPMMAPPAGAFTQNYGAPLLNQFNPPPGYTAGGAIV